MKRLLLSLTCMATLSGYCIADDQPIPMTVTLNIAIADIPPSVSVTGQLLDPSGFQISESTGSTEIFSIKSRNQTTVADYNYVLAFAFGDRYEQFFLNVRDVHFGRTLSFQFDAGNIDHNQKSYLVNNICTNQTSGIPTYIQRIVICRNLYYSYLDSTVIDRFTALRGWFDASVALASTPSSIFDVDPDVRKVTTNLESSNTDDAAVRQFHLVFPVNYVTKQLGLTKQSRLADIRHLTDLLKTGDYRTALKVNDYTSKIFDELAKNAANTAPAASQNNVVNGLTKTILDGNRMFITSLAKQSAF